VLGADVSTLVALLSKDFLKLVIIAILIATPLAYYGMDKWLEDFVSHHYSVVDARFGGRSGSCYRISYG
jgi:hypothetical protein